MAGNHCQDIATNTRGSKQRFQDGAVTVSFDGLFTEKSGLHSFLYLISNAVPPRGKKISYAHNERRCLKFMAHHMRRGVSARAGTWRKRTKAKEKNVGVIPTKEEGGRNHFSGQSFLCQVTKNRMRKKPVPSFPVGLVFRFESLP